MRCDHKFIDSNTCLKCGWTIKQEDIDRIKPDQPIPTPRTEAVINEYFEPCEPLLDAVTILARTLERENVIFRNAQKACEDCDAPTIAQFKTLQSERDQLRQALKAIYLTACGEAQCKQVALHAVGAEFMNHENGGKE